EAFKLEDVVPAVVMELDHSNRKLFLSTVDYFKQKDDAEFQAYLAEHPPTNAGTNLADAGLES
ncbi:MAG: hypothetical protein OCC49_01405, partial [Fibrobacterales bacterium]